MPEKKLRKPRRKTAGPVSVGCYRDPKSRSPRQWAVSLRLNSESKNLHLGSYKTAEQGRRILDFIKSLVNSGAEEFLEKLSESHEQLKLAAHEYAGNNFPDGDYSTPKILNSRVLEERDDFRHYFGGGAAAIADRIDLLGELVRSSSVKTIKISNAGYAVVDAGDYERVEHLKLFLDARQSKKIVHAVQPTDRPFSIRKSIGKSTQLGRIILNLSADDHRSVQYLNGNTLDLRKSNLGLKLVRGRPGAAPEASPVYVCHEPKKKLPWRVVFIKKQRFGAKSYLGYYATKEQAARIVSIVKSDIRRARDSGDDLYSVENQKRLRYAAYHYAAANFPPNDYSTPRDIYLSKKKERTAGCDRQTFPAWSEDDREILRVLFPETPTGHLCLLLGRTKGTIENTARQMGFRRSPEYISRIRIRAHYQSAYPKELVETAQTLGELNRLIRETENSRWTAESLSSFKQLYPETSNAELAKIFKCSIASVRSTACRLRLRKSEAYRRKRWYIRKNSKTQPLAKPITVEVNAHA